MGDQDAARAVDSLSGHHGRLLCWLRPSSGADERWWRPVGTWVASESPPFSKFKRHPDVTVVGGDFGIKDGFRKDGFWFYVGGAPADLVFSSPDFPTDGSVDIEASLNVARSSLRLSSRVEERGRNLHLGCEVIEIDYNDERIYDIFEAVRFGPPSPPRSAGAPSPAAAPARSESEALASASALPLCDATGGDVRCVKTFGYTIDRRTTLILIPRFRSPFRPLRPRAR
ncbi:hypothetical protein M885DRAFT_552293 [Pelagophyceae sp. CCMP2097]|nr:hypothetical protein M885DRAFT_552293 [Pelagophyceae sp. CCMP2097]